MDVALGRRGEYAFNKVIIGQSWIFAIQFYPLLLFC